MRLRWMAVPVVMVPAVVGLLSLSAAAVYAAGNPNARSGAPAKPDSGAEAKPAPAAEQMDNPQFLAWTKFDVGASSTLTTTVQGGQGVAMEIETMQKLVEKGDDHVVIEAKPSVKIGETVQQLPAQRQTVQAKTEKKDVKKLPDEKVTAAGQTFTCKVYQMKQPSPRGGGEVEAKVWFSDKVPGGTVKLQGAAPQAKFTMLLKSFSEK